MVQRGENFDITFKPCESIRIIREGLRQDLQRHVPVELGISGSIDFAHAALADEGGDIVVAESGTDVEGHRLCVIYWRSSKSILALERVTTPPARTEWLSESIRTPRARLQQSRGWEGSSGLARRA